MARKSDREQFTHCRGIKRSDALVVWDDPDDLRGNWQHILARHALTFDEVESVLSNDDNQIVLNRSGLQHCLVRGYTLTDRFIYVSFEILDRNPPIIRPITAFDAE
jgi:hypothetical protein